MSKKKKIIVQAEGDHLILEKVNYNEEQTTTSGIIIKRSQILDSSFVESKIVSMGQGLPSFNGEVPEVKYGEGDTILYDARSRMGMHEDFDVIRREHVVAVIVG